jgi:hypothetical protein
MSSSKSTPPNGSISQSIICPVSASPKLAGVCSWRRGFTKAGCAGAADISLPTSEAACHHRWFVIVGEALAVVVATADRGARWPTQLGQRCRGHPRCWQVDLPGNQLRQPHCKRAERSATVSAPDGSFARLHCGGAALMAVPAPAMGAGACRDI